MTSPLPSPLVISGPSGVGKLRKANERAFLRVVCTDIKYLWRVFNSCLFDHGAWNLSVSDHILLFTTIMIMMMIVHVLASTIPVTTCRQEHPA
jgi:hypothetical protein